MSTISALAPSANVQIALREASARTGVDFDYLLRTAGRESSYKTNVKSKTSSATGLFQFIEQTWFQMVKKAGAAAGISDYARAIKTTPSGRHFVADQSTKSAILALRKNPKMSAFMAGVFTQENAQELNRSLGRPVKNGELYIAHFLGVKSASKLISTAQQSPNTKAAQLFPKAANANRPIFYDKSGHARSVASVYRNLMANFTAGPVTLAKTTPQVPANKTVARADVLFVASNRKPDGPLNIIPAGLMAANRGGLFAGFYSKSPSGTSPVKLSSAYFDLFSTDLASATKVHTARSAKFEVALNEPVQHGTKPLLHNLFSTGIVRPLFS